MNFWQTKMNCIMTYLIKCVTSITLCCIQRTSKVNTGSHWVNFTVSKKKLNWLNKIRSTTSVMTIESLVANAICVINGIWVCIMSDSQRFNNDKQISAAHRNAFTKRHHSVSVKLNEFMIIKHSLIILLVVNLY